VGFSWFLWIGGGPTINPLNAGWLSGDWLQHWLGFLFFKREPWAFPLGTLSTIPYPIGTTIAFTDSNPLVAIPLKLVAGWLPDELQFIGLWLALCFVLQGYFGARLASVVTDNRVMQWLGGCLFAMSPVLPNRVGHDTLCAQWILLALLYLGFRRYADARSLGRSARAAVALVWLSAAIHPYLLAMSVALALACQGRMAIDYALPWRSAARNAALMFAGALSIMAIVGYFGGESATLGGFGLYSADVLALVDPRHTSHVIPPLPTTDAQWEGFAFLGVGGLATVGIAAIVAAIRRPVRFGGRWLVIAVIGAMAVYSLSSEIRLGGEVIARVPIGYRWLGSLTDTFRASGRFIWPLHYLLLLFGVWGLSRPAVTWRKTVATATFGAALVFQAWDFRMNPFWFSQKTRREVDVSSRSFALVKGHFDHLALYPAQVTPACGRAFDEALVYRYALAAYRLGLTYNSGTFARVDPRRAALQCATFPDPITPKDVDRRTVYVVSPELAPAFASAASCGRFDGDWICVSHDADDAFRALVETGKEPPR